MVVLSASHKDCSPETAHFCSSIVSTKVVRDSDLWTVSINWFKILKIGCHEIKGLYDNTKRLRVSGVLGPKALQFLPVLLIGGGNGFVSSV